MVKRTEKKNHVTVGIMIRKMFEDQPNLDENTAAQYETPNMDGYLDALGSSPAHLVIGQNLKLLFMIRFQHFMQAPPVPTLHGT